MTLSVALRDSRESPPRRQPAHPGHSATTSGRSRAIGEIRAGFRAARSRLMSFRAARCHFIIGSQLSPAVRIRAAGNTDQMDIAASNSDDTAAPG